MSRVALQKTECTAFPAAPGAREPPAGQGDGRLLGASPLAAGVRHCVGSGESELNKAGPGTPSRIFHSARKKHKTNMHTKKIHIS